MRVVYKFEAEQDGSYEVPYGYSDPVHFDMQHQTWPTLWCEVDPATWNEGVTRFRIYGTGHPIGDNHRHVMSCIDRQLGLVWHLYKVK